MHSPVSDYLAELLDSCREHDSGEPAGYIPELSRVDTSRLGMAVSTLDGVVYSAGDATTSFTIQSISKTFVYGIAIEHRGLDAVLAKIGVEPSGEAFNELSLEEGNKRPRNPMINAGAITCHALLDDTPEERNARLDDGLARLSGRELTVDEEVYGSEIEVAHRNLAIGHMLRNYDIIDSDPEEIVHGYIRGCAVRVTAEDLALMAATLANGGVQPRTGERVLSAETVRQVLSVMATCGMYDGSGGWLASIGIPAKSGVGGGIIGALPGQLGIASYSPRLDPRGNSVRGMQAFQRLSSDMGMHIFEVPDTTRSVIASLRTVDTDEGQMRELRLQGNLQFAAAERITRTISEDGETELPLLIDLDEVFTMNHVAARALHEMVRRVAETGRRVIIVDPDGLLAARRPDDDVRAKVLTASPVIRAD